MYRWQFLLALLLLIISAVLYGIHYLIFHDSHHIFIYLIGDIAFVPIEVLLVTLIIHRLLEVQQKQSLLKKLNMVIGIFFTEAGTLLLKELSGFCQNIKDFQKYLLISTEWKTKDFYLARKKIGSFSHSLNICKKNPDELKSFLSSKRNFFLDLLGNPNLLEHEDFSELMWAILHFTEELEYRKSLNNLPDSDLEHLCSDMKRVYSLLLLQWLNYMEHLKLSYPYLFSLTVRTNPFNPEASPIIE